MTNDQQAPTATVTTPTDREIHIERVFDAPRDRVFAVYTDPKLMGVPSLAASRSGAAGLATDASVEALELLACNASRNGLDVDTAQVDWAPGSGRLPRRSPPPLAGRDASQGVVNIHTLG